MVDKENFNDLLKKSDFHYLIENVISKIELEQYTAKIILPHCWRVMYLVYRLAAEMGSEDRDIIKAGFLHDLGKLGISRAVLLKRGSLTDYEFELVKGHSHLANVMIKNLLKEPLIARYVGDHHERWDGKGYPRGVSQHEITLGGRMLAVADSFDAMVLEPVPYINNLPLEKAFQELIEGKYFQFDGKIVDIFIKLFKDGKLTLSEIWKADSLFFEEIRKHSFFFNLLEDSRPAAVFDFTL